MVEKEKKILEKPIRNYILNRSALALSFNPLWWIDVPAWQKMYFFGIVGGIYISFWFYWTFMIPEIKSDVKEIKRRYHKWREKTID